jgi:hypothetical protein
MDLQVSADNKLVAATHGKGVFVGDLYAGEALSVKLVDFGGINRGQYNQLYWTVTDEQDILNYELERSVDGRNYQRVVAMTALNDPGNLTYRHNDPVHAGSNEYYYRLKVLENDVTYFYSAVIFIRTGSLKKITVHNNPFKDFIVLRYSIPEDQKISAALYNSSGALLKRQDLNATAGSGIYTLYGFDHFPAGPYILKTTCGDLQQSFKLIRQ